MDPALRAGTLALLIVALGAPIHVGAAGPSKGGPAIPRFVEEAAEAAGELAP